MLEKPWLKQYDPGIPFDLEPSRQSLAEILAETAARYPDQPALIFGARVGSRLLDSAISWRQLNAAVDRFAAGLQKIGVKPGDRVAVMLPNCPQFVIAAYAAWRIGAILVCCNPLYVSREVEHLVRDSGAETFIVMSSLYGRIRDIRARAGLKRVVVTNIKDYFPPLLKILFTLTSEKKEGHRVDLSGETDTVRFLDLLQAAPARPEPAEVRPDDIATLIYTGGTTGGPKGAQHTHSSQSYNAGALKVWSGCREGQDVMLCVMPFFHIYGLAVVLNTIVAAGLTGVLIPNPRDMQHVLLAVQKHRITYYLGVPAMFAGFNNFPGVKNHDLTSLRFAASAAAPLAPEIQTRFEAITGGKMVEAYGLTETIAVCMDPINNARPHSIGVPLPGIELRIVDPEAGTTELPPGEVGEIVVKGPTVMPGYWNNPDQTAAALRSGPDGQGGWFHTGDLGYMEEDGFFHIVDRQKDLIIAGGYNIYPSEIEAVLYEHPSVLEAAVIGVPDEKRGESVKAFAVLRDGVSVTEEEILSFCRERMAAYKVPRSLELRPELPKSVIGKILRRSLREEELGKAGVSG